MGKNYIKIGEKYNLLTVVEKTSERTKSGCVIYKCLCDCGNFIFAISSNLVNNHTKSCGCYHDKISKERMLKNSKKYLELKNPKQITPNKIIEKENYLIIICSNKEVLIDKDDYNKIKNERWFVSNGYCCNSKYNSLHRKIMNAKKGQIVDHINSNKLDNRKENLRFVTKSQNGQNRKCRGYSYNKKTKKWIVNIVVNKKKYYIGNFSTEEEAKNARKQAEIKYQGEYRYNEN